MLERSIKLNKFDVKVINKAVHEKSGVQYFCSNGPWGYIVTEENQYFLADSKEKIECICLDDWIKTQDIIKIDFIKMDIEGSEPAALRGMNGLLVKYGCPPIFCEINSCTLALYGETQKSLYDTISGLGYKPYQILDSNSLIEFDISEPPFIVVRDLLFVKDIAKIRYKVLPFIKKGNGKIISRIQKQLSYYKSWKQNNYAPKVPEIESADYICLALRDYPQYMEDKRIKKLLAEIKKMENKYTFLEKCLEWYKI